MSTPAETAAATTTPDRGALERRIAEVSRMMRAHAGGIELLDVSRDGAVRVRFTGMCAGCLFRPLTMRGTIAPALTSLAGVSAVHADGARISEEAAERLAGYLEGAPLLGRWRAGGEEGAGDG